MIVKHYSHMTNFNFNEISRNYTKKLYLVYLVFSLKLLAKTYNCYEKEYLQSVIEVAQV